MATDKQIAWMKSGHTPEARRKAVATMLANLAKKRREAAMEKRGGTTTTIDVSTLPKRPVKSGNRSKTRRLFTAAQKIKFVQRVNAATERGESVEQFCKKTGVHHSLFYLWRKDKKLMKGKAALNGHAVLDASAVQLTLVIGGEPVQVSLQEARQIHAGLEILLNPPPNDI